MVDADWLKHLAGASIKDGHWNVSDPEGVRRLTEERVSAAIVALEEEAREAAEVHNSHARSERAVSVLSLASNGDGFILLLGKCQVTLTYSDRQLIGVLAGVSGFRRISRELCSLTPQADTFGTIVWRGEGPLLMSNELIVKRLFEELTRAALALGN